MARTEKLERLLKLTAVLLDSARPLSAAEIRLQVPGYPEVQASFNRAFERDKDDLRALGIPLKTVLVPYSDPPVDGYDIAPSDYYLPDPNLTPDELAALRLAALTVRFDGSDEAAALWKLGGLVPFGEDSTIADPLASLPTSPALVGLFGAIVECRRVSFSYSEMQREVSPWRLEYARGRWYLIGFDHGRNAERNFRLDRIPGDVTTTGEAGNAMPAPSEARERTLRAWEIGEDQPVTATLWLGAERAAIGARLLGPSVSEGIDSGGGTEFQVSVTNTDAFRFFVLGFGDQAEIKGPPELRSEIVDWLEAMAGER